MTPTQTIVASANQTREVQDASGRTLVLRRLNALDRLRLLKAAGPELAQNDAWLNVAALAASVVSINGIPCATPASERQIEQAVLELGDTGLEAVAEILRDTMDDSLLFEGIPEGNSVGTPS